MRVSPDLQQGNAVEGEDAAGAALDTFAAGQAMAVMDRLAAPGVGADIDANRTVVGTDAALDAAHRVGDDLGFGKRLVAGKEIGRPPGRHRGTSCINSASGGLTPP